MDNQIIHCQHDKDVKEIFKNLNKENLYGSHLRICMHCTLDSFFNVYDYFVNGNLDDHHVTYPTHCFTYRRNVCNNCMKKIRHNNYVMKQDELNGLLRVYQE